ncbi:MAG: hypothetical protein HN729_04490 [Candidatus Marinimicrobia bacterium]|jgi:hypothetical protein|nr:hypothetical protein [Candidatus Neomarinimicrobiota bacterium]MBT3633818.1 hypothetical protein [Candidatus Neomarinimicrobiota bacterium]MBT3682610.1 hypothetical protein [Candidatus Neomarinimicrobiota bacterium]MBT3759374.1 hypothetical protein [Candidatus Neomarinimicrobiota bacterium]MBT3894618.1 hypothetical protein [Candidatus Neomarinimicrobiota bacterium]
MKFLLFLPVVFSTLLISAHFFRSGNMIFVAVCLLMPFILFVRKTWTPKVVQIFLILASAEWLWTAYTSMIERMQYGVSWGRMVIILVTVALVTFLSSLVFRSKTLMNHYMGDINDTADLDRNSV